MLKKFYKIPILFSLLLLIFIPISAYARSGQSTVPVIYNISEDMRYDLSIKVSGDGAVLNGAKSIRNENLVHQIKVSEEKTFEIIPDKGSGLKSISWKSGDTDLSKYYEIEDIKNGKKLSLKGVAADSELTIQFDGKDNISGDSGQDKNDSIIKDDSIKNPQTGDKGMLGWIILSILSLAMLLIFRIVDSKRSGIKK
ncbi:hypothetical protein [Faecalimicrobium sp. JNUCC 81]